MYDDISDYGMAFGKKEKFIWISTRAKKKAGGWGEETDDICAEHGVARCFGSVVDSANRHLLTERFLIQVLPQGTN